MTCKILNPSEVDFSKIFCGSPFVNGNVVVVPLYYEKKQPIIIKLPDLYCDTIYTDKTTDLGLTIVGKNDSDMSHIITFLKIFDQFVVENAKKNSKLWKLNVNIRYKPLHIEVDSVIKNCPNGIIKLQIINNNDFSTKIYNNEKKILQKNELFEYVNGNCYVKSIVEFSSIIINNGQDTSVYTRTHQLRISKGQLNIVVLNDYAISDSDTDNDDNDEKKFNENYENNDNDDNDNDDDDNNTE